MDTLESDIDIINSLDEKKRRLNYFKRNFPEILNRISKEFDINDNFSKSLYNYTNNIKSEPECLCSKKLKFINFLQGYRKYCSKKCAMSDINLIEKRNQKSKLTSLKNWGTDNPMKNELVKNKLKENNRKKWGVDNFTKTDDYKLKVKNKNLEKWGYEWYQSTDDFKIKAKQKMLEKYGFTHYMKNPSKVEEFKKSNLERWGVDNYTKTGDYKVKMKDYFLSEKFTETVNQNKSKLKEKIFNYYKNFNPKYKVISIESDSLIVDCNECDSQFVISKQLYYLRTKNSQICCTNCNATTSKNTSYKEKSLLSFIKSIYDCEIIENYKIDRREIDIYLPHLNMGFEFNGIWWHSELYKDKNYHINKNRIFKENNITLFNIWEDDWEYKKPIVESIIRSKLNKSLAKIYARKCLIREVTDNKLIKTFLTQNHIQGFLGAKVKLGLFHNEELVSLMTFGELRKPLGQNKTNGHWELLRFCSKINYMIIGAASKLFSYFINNYKPNEIISYCNNSYSNGRVYHKLNMDYCGETLGYHWVKDGLRMNRFKFRKSILKEKGYEGTENSIMVERGYFKLWDCGQSKFKWTSQKENSKQYLSLSD